MALCSLSTGNKSTPRFWLSAITNSPAATITSLLASATRFPACTAEGGWQADNADRCGNHDVHLWKGGYGYRCLRGQKRCRAGGWPGRCQPLGQLAGACFGGHGNDFWLMTLEVCSASSAILPPAASADDLQN